MLNCLSAPQYYDDLCITTGTDPQLSEVSRIRSFVFRKATHPAGASFTLVHALRKAIQTEPESRRQWMLDLFKKAKENHSRNKNYQFWQYGNHAEEIYTLHFMWDKLNYIHLNPIRAGIVEKAQHYIYSSASNYVNNKGLLNVEMADNPIIDVIKKNEFWKYNNYDE